MMSCRDVSTSVAAGRRDEEPLRRRVEMYLHLLMCRHCRRFWKQLQAVDRGLRAALVGLERDAPADLEERVVKAATRQPPGERSQD